MQVAYYKSGIEWWHLRQSNKDSITSFSQPLSLTLGPPGPPAKAPPIVPQTLRQPQIAFYIGLSESIDQIPGGENCPLIFDTVILNVGGFYNASNGVFTTKISGVYTFLLVVSARSYEKVRRRISTPSKPE